LWSGRRRRDLEDLAGAHRAEAVAGETAVVEGGIERLDRLLDAFVGELERAPVMAGHMGGVAGEHAFHRLLRVLVLPLHEPARLIGAERKIGEAETAVLFPRGPVVDAAVEA